MHELLREDAGPGTDAVRVVRADEVAALRRSEPDSAIVGLVGSTSAGEAIAAQLAGADVVLPCVGDAAPGAADLEGARTAARILAGRARVARETTRVAAHEFAGNASAVAMAAQLLGPADRARADQLRRLAARGAHLSWSAGRVARSSGTVVELVDLAAVVSEICLGIEPRGHLDLQVDTAGPAAVPVLVDRVRLAEALSHLIDNARRAGAGAAVVRVDIVRVDRAATTPGGGTSDTATVSVVDDGSGLPDGWTADEALAPFASGWSPRGDGLGLAEVAEFAADHGGALCLQPRNDGPGLRAVLRLPVVEPDMPSGHEVIAGRSDAIGNADPDWALASILEGIARRDPLEQSLEALVATMERYLPDSICSILLLDQDTATLRHGAGARLPAPYRAAIDGLAIGPLAGSCGTAAFTRQEVVVADVAIDDRWADYYHHALQHGLRSCWSRPILDVDRRVVLGTFAVYHRYPWLPGPSERGVVQRLTHVAAVAIGTAALHGQLVESEARFRSTFEAAGLGIALVGPSGTIQEANAALTAMAGRPLVGESMAGLLVDEDADATGEALGSVLARPGDDGRLATAEVRVHRADQEPVWVAMSGSLIRGPAGEPRHFCIELFDLTERRRVAQARRERAVAEAADRAKSELLALVSHEVRTPLNAVIGFAQVLQNSQLPPERQRDGIEHILGAGRHLLQLINDLLDLTGAEAGRLHLVPETTAPREVVAEAIQIVAGLAAERGIAVRTCAADTEPAVWADRQRLRQVLLNLLGNAIKFTTAGGAVEIALAPGEIIVRDTGDGIPADQLPFLFTPFHRAGKSSAEGSGLGLALSQRLMSAMDGDLALVSSSAEGTTFRLLLPLAQTARSAVPADPGSATLSRPDRSPVSTR